MKDPMPLAVPPGRKHDIAPDSRSAQSLGRNVRPSLVMPCMKNSRDFEDIGKLRHGSKHAGDGLGGIAVNTLGHAHPKFVPALHDQVNKLIHSSNYYEVPLQEQLAAKLCEISGLSSVFFCNSGLEANEGAIKIARKYGHDKGI